MLSFLENLPPLSEGAAVVLAVPAQSSKPLLAALEGACTEAELRLLASVEERRLQRSGAWGLRRLILAHYLACAPAALAFVRSDENKPSLSPAFASSKLHFSVSYADKWVLLAVARGSPIGVDVEALDPMDFAAVAKTFMTPAELNTWSTTITRLAQPTAFFQLWTRKEALLKATGEGLTRDPRLVEVGFTSPALVDLHSSLSEFSHWRIWDFKIGSQLAAAVCRQATLVSPALLRLAEVDGHTSCVPL